MALATACRTEAIPIAVFALRRLGSCTCPTLNFFVLCSEKKKRRITTLLNIRSGERLQILDESFLWNISVKFIFGLKSLTIMKRPHGKLLWKHGQRRGGVDIGSLAKIRNDKERVATGL